MLTFLLICGLAASPANDAAKVIHVDRIDVNHVYRWDGSIQIDQLILWRWSRHDQRFYSQGFVLLNGGRVTDDADHKAEWDRKISKAHRGKSHLSWPHYKGKWVGCREVPRWNGRKWVSQVEKNGKWFEIRADAVIETHTPHDPEATDRAATPYIKREVWK